MDRGDVGAFGSIHCAEVAHPTHADEDRGGSPNIYGIDFRPSGDHDRAAVRDDDWLLMRLR